MNIFKKATIVGACVFAFTGIQNANAFAVNNGSINQPGSASDTANQVVVNHIMFDKEVGTGINFMPQLRYQTSKLIDTSVPSITVKTKSIGVSLNITYDIDNTTFGVIVPIDIIRRSFTEASPLALRVSTASTLHESRYGIVGFARHNFVLSERISLSPSVMASYIKDNKGNAYAPGAGLVSKSKVNTKGIGFNLAMNYKREKIATSLAIGYQYNKDDSGTLSTINGITPWDDQKLLRLGFKGSVYATPMIKLGVNAVWNKDTAAFLKDNNMSTSYTNLGADITYLASDQFDVTMGYTGLIGYTRANSSVLHLGGNWEF